MATEIDRFQYKGFDVVSEISSIGAAGALEGYCTVFSESRAIDRPPLGPMITNEEEARAFLRDAGKSCIDRWIAMDGRLPLRDGTFVINGQAQQMADGTWGAKCVVTVHRGFEAVDHMIETDGEYRKTRTEAEAIGLQIGIQWVNNNFPI